MLLKFLGAIILLSKGPLMPLVFNLDPTATEIIAQVTKGLGSGKETQRGTTSSI
jgi:hypothetical protein